MKTLLLLRHAKSSWKDPSLIDHDRPLKKRGKRDAPRMGELLREEDLVPDLILSSTALRAWKTAELVAEYCGYDGEVERDPNLYHADPYEHIEVLHNVRDTQNCVMLVGHNPGLEWLLEMLTGEDEVMPTAALAQIHLPIQLWPELDEDTEGELVKLWWPRYLR